MKHLLLILFCLLCLVPVAAQDATLEAAPTPIYIPVEQIPDETPAILSLTLGEALAILVGTVSLFVGFGKILWDANQNPSGQSLDSQVTAAIEERHGDRDYIEGLEKAHAASNEALKTALNATVSVLQTIAPLTPVKLDDAALSLLKDVQTPGVATVTTTTTTGGYVETSAAPMPS